MRGRDDMKQIKCLIVILIFGITIIGCKSTKNSYEVTKDIYLNEKKSDVMGVLKSNNLDTTEATQPFNGFVVDYKSYSGSKSNNSKEDFFDYYKEWKPNWAYYDFDKNDKLQSVEYTFICTNCTGTEEFFQIAKDYGFDKIDYEDYFTSNKIKIKSGVFVEFDWDNISERGTITIGLN